MSINNRYRIRQYRAAEGMEIASIICPASIAEKLETRHHVTVRETRQVLLTTPRIRFAEKGHTEGEDVYVAFGQTFGTAT